MIFNRAKEAQTIRIHHRLFVTTKVHPVVHIVTGPGPLRPSKALYYDQWPADRVQDRPVLDQISFAPPIDYDAQHLLVSLNALDALTADRFDLVHVNLRRDL